MTVFLRVLAVLYFIACGLHCADLLDLRLKFSEMNSVWKMWIIYLAIADLFAAIGLWRQTKWGVALFVLVAVSQLIAYTAFPNVFGGQIFLIVFHIVTLTVFVFLRFRLSAIQRNAS